MIIAGAPPECAAANSGGGFEDGSGSTFVLLLWDCPVSTRRELGQLDALDVLGTMMEPEHDLPLTCGDFVDRAIRLCMNRRLPAERTVCTFDQVSCEALAEQLRDSHPHAVIADAMAELRDLAGAGQCPVGNRQLDDPALLRGGDGNGLDGDLDSGTVGVVSVAELHNQEVVMCVSFAQLGLARHRYSQKCCLHDLTFNRRYDSYPFCMSWLVSASR